MQDIDLGPFRIRPRGDFNPTAQYRFLDSVFYNHSSYLCINYDTIDGVACIGVAPTGEQQSEKYWTIMAEGVKGDIAPQYDGFKELTSLNWDYSTTDKVYLNNTIDVSRKLNIFNVYDGCCGMIVSDKDLILPDNSDISTDFNYIELEDGEYYIYTFVYKYVNETLNRFIWNRAVYTSVVQ